MLTDANQSRVGAKSYLRKYVRACRIIDNRQLPRSLEWSAGDFASMARVNIHKLSGGAHVSLFREQWQRIYAQSRPILLATRSCLDHKAYKGMQKMRTYLENQSNA